MNNADKEFKGERVVVVTGATRGLGRSLSLTFGAAGYDVIGIYRADSASAEKLESEFGTHGYRGFFIKQDITNDENWSELDELIEINKGKRFTLIANASVPFVPKPFHLTDWQEISAQLEVNVKGSLLILKRLLPPMVKARAGTVVSVLTTALSQPPPKGFAAYVIAKSALEGLTRAVASEYASRGLRAFSVSPGFMETSFTDGWSEHLKASIYSRAEDVKSPSETAASIFALAEDPNTAGRGENYVIG